MFFVVFRLFVYEFVTRFFLSPYLSFNNPSWGRTFTHDAEAHRLPKYLKLRTAQWEIREFFFLILSLQKRNETNLQVWIFIHVNGNHSNVWKHSA